MRATLPGTAGVVATTPVLLGTADDSSRVSALGRRLSGVEVGECSTHRFPDGEVKVGIETPVVGREVAIVCSLDQPGDRILPLLFLAATARDLGAARVGLVAPYLAYMRQDDRFHPGDGITSTYFAGLLSRAFDWLVTVDPHLHRWPSLDRIYTIPSRIVHAAPAIAAWIADQVADPIIIGPDAESEQWVSAVASAAGAPSLVLQKVRHGDRDVEISAPDRSRCQGRNPVVVDDIISSGQTMAETVIQLRAAGLPAPVCIGIHAVFAPGADDAIMRAGAGQLVTCNTIIHETNAIDIDELLADAVGRMIGDR